MPKTRGEAWIENAPTRDCQRPCRFWKFCNGLALAGRHCTNKETQNAAPDKKGGCDSFRPQERATPQSRRLQTYKMIGERQD